MSRAVSALLFEVLIVALFVSLIASEPAGAQRGTPWTPEVAVTTETTLGGCAIGDLLPDRRGQEIVAVGADGSIHVAYRERGRWRSERIHQAKGALVQVAVGDVLADHAGNEIVAVGNAEGSERDDAPGVAIVLWRAPDGWKAETVFRSKALLHGVCTFGNDVIVTGYDAAVHRLRRANGAWRAERLAALSAAGKSVIRVPGGIVVACVDGAVVRIEPVGDRWRAGEIDRRAAGRARLATDRDRLLVADDDGTVSLLDLDATDGDGTLRREVVFRDTAKARGALLADLVPGLPGLEIATAGYSKRLTLLRQRGGRWRAKTLFEDTASLHHLVAGDVDGRPGVELVTCGHSGRVTVLRCMRPPVRGPQAGNWRTEVAFDLGLGMGGCAAGDLVAERPGAEIAVVSKDGGVHVVHRAGADWVAATVHRARGELIQVAIGDVDPRSPGNEIIAVGVAEGSERSDRPGAAVIVRREGDGWRGERVFLASALQHGACAFGGAAFVTGYDRAVHRLRFIDGAWRADKVSDLPGPGKQLLATSRGIVIACRDGTVGRLEEAGGAFRFVVLDRRRSGRARLGTDGTRIVVSDDDGTFSVIEPSAGAGPWQREEIHREFDLQRGAVLADLDPNVPGLEAATAGYECKITLLTRSSGRWWSRMLFRDSDHLHHLAVGNVDGRPGPELIACGYSGRLLVLRRVSVARSGARADRRDE